MLIRGLVDAEQHPLPLLAHVGAALEIDAEGQLALQRRDLRDGLGDQVVVLQRGHRQVDPDHPPALLGPQPAGVDHMPGDDGALLGHHLPAAVAARMQLQHPVVLDHGGAPLAGRDGVGMDHAGGVDMALTLVMEPAQHARDVDHRQHLLDLFRADQPAAFDAHGLEHPVGVLQPFPALRRGGEVDPAGHVQADVLARLGLDLRQQVDGVGLQRGDVGVGVQGMDAARRVPRRARGQHAALEQCDVGPAELGQVIQHRGADHAAADDHHPILRFHRRHRLRTHLPAETLRKAGRPV